MNAHSNMPWYATILPLAALWFASDASAAGATLWIANDGADSATCGARTRPCRSISQGIENASDGDTIEVGAGRYGNISGAVDYSGPGDEHAQLTNVPGYAACVVCINKAVHIFSLHGAAVTIIQGTAVMAVGSDPPAQATANVMIMHDGVVFGSAGRGFTLTGGMASGVVIDQDAPQTDFGISLKQNVTVAGNVDVADGTGFVFNGLEFMDDPCPDPSCTPTAQILFEENEAIGNGTGYSVTINAFHAGPITLQGNLARGAGTGFGVVPGFQDESGAAFGAGAVVLLGNVAVHGGTGFNADAPGRMVANTAAGNSQLGFLIVPGGGAFSGNSALGNAGPGAIVQFSVDGLDTQPTNSFQTFSGNNFYGNDRNRPMLALQAENFGAFPGPYNPGPSAHCGVLNLGSLAAAVGPEAGPPPTIKLPAAGNFWGSSNGPAPTGGGDAAGGACDQNGGVTVTKPFATLDFAITGWQ